MEVICTAIVVKLEKIFYSEKKLLYVYNNRVEVPILGMVDDVINMTKCYNQTLINNVFMKANKLELAKKKCSGIHVGKTS